MVNTGTFALTSVVVLLAEESGGSDNWGPPFLRAIITVVVGFFVLFGLTLLVAAAALWRGRVRRARLRRLDQAVDATSVGRVRPADGEPPWTPDDDLWGQVPDAPGQQR